ncbi:uncharacterized protein PG998_007240 [Apiospora kogelbergensis]|uniref:uncharacterized protein n=1 Tax=Apiospora kogelbergensis TaxID=1337665 RepID=UPI0031300C24
MVDCFDRFTIRAFLASFVAYLVYADRLSVLWGRCNEPLGSWYLLPIEMMLVVSFVTGLAVIAYCMGDEEDIQRYVKETLPALERDLVEMVNWAHALSRDSNQRDAWLDAKIDWLRTPKTCCIEWNRSVFHIACWADSAIGVPVPRIQMGTGIGKPLTQMRDEETPRSEEEVSTREIQEGTDREDIKHTRT